MDRTTGRSDRSGGRTGGGEGPGPFFVVVLRPVGEGGGQNRVDPTKNLDPSEEIGSGGEF